MKTRYHPDSCRNSALGKKLETSQTLGWPAACFAGLRRTLQPSEASCGFRARNDHQTVRLKPKRTPTSKRKEDSNPSLTKTKNKKHRAHGRTTHILASLLAAKDLRISAVCPTCHEIGTRRSRSEWCSYPCAPTSACLRMDISWYFVELGQEVWQSELYKICSRQHKLYPLL